MEFVGFCVRIDNYEGYTDKIQALGMLYPLCIAVKHFGTTKENQHYHIVIKSDIQQQTFRKRMKLIFNSGSGNGHMAIKNWDGNNDAISYLFHEDPDAVILVRQGCDDEFITRMKHRNVEVQVEVSKAKSKSSHLLYEPAYQHFKNVKTHFHDRDIATFILLHAMRMDKYAPQPWLLKAMVSKVLFMLCEGDTAKEDLFARDLVDAIYGRM